MITVTGEYKPGRVRSTIRTSRFLWLDRQSQSPVPMTAWNETRWATLGMAGRLRLATRNWKPTWRIMSH